MKPNQHTQVLVKVAAKANAFAPANVVLLLLVSVIVLLINGTASGY